MAAIVNHAFDDGSRAMVYRVRTEGSGRDVYAWSLWDADGVLLGGDTDLRTGVGGGTDVETLAALLSFFSACAESRPRGGENADLFNEAVGQWAEAHDDELAMAVFGYDGFSD